MLQFLKNLSSRQRTAFVTLALLILVGGGLALWWVLRPTYAVLASNLRPTDASEIGTTLSKWGIPYRFGGDGKSLMVPSGQLYQTRIRLAEDGIPRGGAVGFEAFKDSDYGVTEFAQQVNYQRALQGELERTIDAMREVQFSRVHLTIHHAGLFDSSKEASKAAVTLALRPGQSIHAREVRGIQRLVASAVQELQPDAVTVLDQTGAVLSQGADGAADPGVLGDRMAVSSRIEAALRKQARALVVRALGTKNFTVSVAVRINYDKVHRVSDRLLADGRSDHGLLVSEKTQAQPGGTDSGAHGHSSLHSREVDYANGHESEEVDRAPGRIEQISVGIVVPGTLSKSEVVSLDHVVSAGLGLDASRGDHIDIASVTPASHATTLVAQTPRPAGVTQAPSAVAPVAPFHARVAWRRMSWELYLAGAAALLLLLGSTAWLLRRSRASRLSAADREALLDRIQAWCEEPVR